MEGDTDLVLLTEGFPYGARFEPFLEAEIGVLAASFRRVFVLPSKKEPGLRALPPNVQVVDMPWLDVPGRGSRVRALASASALAVLAETLIGSPPGAFRYVRTPRVYLDVLATNLMRARMLRDFVRARGLGDAVFYDYWMENTTLALSLLRRQGVVRTAVARAHRFDLYDETWPAGAVPFRDAKARGLDLIAPISEHGAAYLRERLGRVDAVIEVHHLGVGDHGPGPAPSGPPPTVVSCSMLRPQKRVQRIPEVLAVLGRPVRWIHFGDGPERANVEAACRALPAAVTWELRGQVPNPEVISFYRTTAVDVFLSLSESEGIPVSMMEAQSFGIPVVGVRCQGIPELVGEASGILVQPGASTAGAAASLAAALEPGAWDRGEIRAEVLRRFGSDANHRRFVRRLHELHVGRADLTRP